MVDSDTPHGPERPTRADTIRKMLGALGMDASLPPEIQEVVVEGGPSYWTAPERKCGAKGTKSKCYL